jgi:hypothetical protein
MRNAIVHRGGKADRRLSESCPWLGLKVGDPIRVDHVKYGRYVEAAHKYLLECIQRTRVHFGVPRYSHQKSPTQT